MSSAVLIFSGGQDSTTCLIQALTLYSDVHCLTFDYGQRHAQEISVAKHLCQKLAITHHHIFNTSILNQLTINSLTQHDIPITHQTSTSLPNTFLPGRNILFLALASIYAYQVGADTIITGVSETDFSGYPDCKNDFIKAMSSAINHGLESHLSLLTPLMWLNKAETWALADYYHQFELVRDETLTCYQGIIGAGCQHCPSCQLRQTGLEQYLTNKKDVMNTLKLKTKLA